MSGRMLRRLASAVTAFSLAGALVVGLATSSGGATANDPLVAQGVTAEQHGQYAQAVVDFLNAVKRNQHNYLAWYDLGVLADRRGQTAQAEHDYRSALVGNPKYIPALYNLAVALAGHQPQQAAQLYRRVIALRPRNAAAHLNLGFVLAGLGQTAQAKQQLAIAIGLSPSLAQRVPTALGGTA